MDKHRELLPVQAIDQFPMQDVFHSMQGLPNYHHNHQHLYLSTECCQKGMRLQDLLDGKTTHLHQIDHQDLDLKNRHHLYLSNQIYHCMIGQNYKGRNLLDNRLNCPHTHRYQSPPTERVGTGMHQHRYLDPSLIRGLSNHQGHCQTAFSVIL